MRSSWAWDLALEVDRNGFLWVGCFNDSLGMEIYRCSCFQSIYLFKVGPLTFVILGWFFFLRASLVSVMYRAINLMTHCSSSLTWMFLVFLCEFSFNHFRSLKLVFINSASPGNLCWFVKPLFLRIGRVGNSLIHR